MRARSRSSYRALHAGSVHNVNVLGKDEEAHTTREGAEWFGKVHGAPVGSLSRLAILEESIMCMEGFEARGFSLTDNNTSQEVLKDAAELVYVTRGDLKGLETIDDPEWTKCPEVAAALRVNCIEQTCAFVIYDRHYKKWAVGLSGNSNTSK